VEDEVGVNLLKKSRVFSLFTPELQNLRLPAAAFCHGRLSAWGENGLAAAHTNHRQSRRRVPRVEQAHGV
jgi:hypothetical protein